MPVLFLKAKIRGGAIGDLFAQPTQVEGHMRGSAYVAPYTAIRQVAHEAPPAPPAIPREVENRVRTALAWLRDRAEAIARARQHGSPTDEVMEAEKDLPFIHARMGIIGKFREAARAKGLDPDAILESWGGIPDMGLSEAAQLLQMERAGGEAPAPAPAPPPAPEPAPAPATDLAGGRATYPDGRMIPQPGDTVQRSVPGIFGIPIALEGVVRGKTVQITRGPTNRKTDALSPAWTVKGDPAVERIAAERRAEREAADAAEKARRAAEEAEAEAMRQRLVAERGSLEGQTLQAGDMIEDPEGRAHIIAELDAAGTPYGYAVGEGDQHAASFGKLDGWRRLDTPPPAGAIIESRYGQAKRRTEAGAWEPVIWSERAGGWTPEAEFGAPLTDDEVQHLALSVLDFMQGQPKDAPYRSRPAAMDAWLAAHQRELRGVDEGRVLEAMGEHIAAPDYAERLEAFRADRLRQKAAADKAKPAKPKRKAPDYTSMSAGALNDAIAEADRVGRMLNNRCIAAGWGEKRHSDILAMADRSPLADAVRRNSAWLGALRGELASRRRNHGSDSPLPKATKAGVNLRGTPDPDVAPVSYQDANGAAITNDAGVIHTAYTMDYSSQLHFARDGRGRVWSRGQYRDPRYGYKWAPWKLHGTEMPERAMATTQRAKLPG